jgi:hypothetical protein
MFIVGISFFVYSTMTMRSLSKDLFDTTVDMCPALISSCREHFPSVSLTAVNLNRERCTFTLKIKALTNAESIQAITADLMPGGGGGGSKRARAPSAGNGASSMSTAYVPSAPCYMANADVENAILPVAIAVPVANNNGGRGSLGGSVGGASAGGSFAGNVLSWGRKEKDRESDTSWGKREFAKIKEDEAKQKAKGGKGKK